MKEALVKAEKLQKTQVADEPQKKQSAAAASGSPPPETKVHSDLNTGIQSSQPQARQIPHNAVDQPSSPSPRAPSRTSSIHTTPQRNAEFDLEDTNRRNSPTMRGEVRSRL